MRLYLRLELPEKFGHKTQDGVVVMQIIVDKTVRTVVDRAI